MTCRATGAFLVLLISIASCGGRVAGDDPGLGQAGGGSGGTHSGGAGGTHTGGAAGMGGPANTGGSVPAGGSAGVGGDPWDAAIDGSTPTPQQLCAMQGIIALDPCSTQEMSDRLIRRWWQCSGQFIFLPEDGVGVEFVGGGTWYALKLDPGGAIVHGTGSDYQGTWKLTDTSSMNGPCSIEVQVSKAGGWVGGFPEFTEQPMKMYLNTGGDGPAPTFAAIP